MNTLVFLRIMSQFKFLGGHQKQLKMDIDFYKKVNYNEKNQQTRMKNFQKLGSMTKETDMSKKIIKENHKEAEILKINLHEKKKSIERNILQWMKQKLNQSSMENIDQNYEELLSNLIVYIELDINSPNDLRSYIKCYCGVQSSVSIRVTAGYLKKLGF